MLTALLLLACADPAEPEEDVTGSTEHPSRRYDATVRWTAYGVPHVLAGDYGSLGYGLGYAFARDHGCVLADQIAMVHSERAKHFGEGPDGLYVNQDIGWLALGVRRQAEAGFPTLDLDAQKMLEGYAHGFNRARSEGLFPCAGEPWARDFTGVDLLTYYLALGLNGSGAVWVDAVGSAVPPDVASRPSPPGLEPLERAREPMLGSNGWAIGRDRTASGGGMLLSNTHFPYVGEKQWHESHLTIPGELDVYGASLMGIPVINLGFNRNVAWTHTVSNTPRFIVYLLPLDPKDPTRYLYDGEYRDMEETEYSVEVLQEDGSLETVTRTMYRSHYGPVFNAPLVGWASNLAFSYRDANEYNIGMIEMWMRMNRAESLAEFQAAHAEVNAIPWVHTLAADAEGNAWYTDSASTPNLSPAAEAAYAEFVQANSLSALLAQYGVIAVDGADPVYEWVEADGARDPGLVPFSDAPQLLRSDYVFNANDNHWLTNPAELLEGFPMLYGAERTARAPRTRMNALYLSQTGEGSASGEDGLFTLEELQAAALDGRALMAELLREDVVARCEGAGEVAASNGDLIDITAACGALAGWDGRLGVESQGAVLWREWLGGGRWDWSDADDYDGLFAVPFDASDPVNTPTGLFAAPAEGADLALQELADAVRELDGAGLAVDVPLGEAQYQIKGSERVPVPGGQSFEGAIAISVWSNGSTETLLSYPQRGEVLNEDSDLTVDGYPINNGNSFILTVELTDEGPRAAAVVSYSQSEHEGSPHFADQSWLYASQQLRAVLFEEEDILADPELVELQLEMDLPD